MNYVGKQRLLKLAKFLREKVEDKNFDLTTIKNETKCVSTACALGYFPKCFPGHGFQLNNESAYHYPGTKKYFYTLSNKSGNIDYDVASKFFGIGYGDSLHLFSPSYYPKSHRSRNYVVKRIESFVKQLGV